MILFNIFVFILLIGNLIIFINYYFFLIILLTLEFIGLSIFGVLIYILNFFNIEVYFLIVYLILIVCEGVLGLSILVFLYRIYRRDYTYSYNLLC